MPCLCHQVTVRTLLLVSGMKTIIPCIILIITSLFFFSCSVDDKLDHRLHMNEETQALYDRIRQANGWFLGLGRLVGPRGVEQEGELKLRPTANRDVEFCLAWWRQTFGGSQPACFEFDLTMQWGMKEQLSLPDHRKRVYEMAQKFSELGGIPWFRDHSENHATKNAEKDDPSVLYFRTHYDVSVRLAEMLKPSGKGNTEFMSYYRQLAKEIKVFGKPCVLRIFHEANGMWFWWGGDPENFRKMWKEVFNIFQSEGVKNVIWCYNISRYIKRITPPGRPSLEQVGVPADYYTGDRYVDLLSFDAWCDAPHITREADKAFLDLHEMGGDRPVFLGEFGPKAREDFYRNLPDDLSVYPRFKGLNFWLENRSLVYEKSEELILKHFNDFITDPRIITLERWRQ